MLEGTAYKYGTKLEIINESKTITWRIYRVGGNFEVKGKANGRRLKCTNHCIYLTFEYWLVLDCDLTLGSEDDLYLGRAVCR